MTSGPEGELYEKYRGVGEVTPGGALRLPLRHALDFVAACQQRDLAVIGIEGMVVDGGRTFPQMDLIADYSTADAASARMDSWEAYREHCNREARDLLRSAPARPGLLFEITVLAPPAAGWARSDGASQ